MTYQQLNFAIPKCSLVIQLVDTYTLGPPIDPRISVTLQEEPLKKPVYKPGNGLCIFTDLPAGTYTVDVRSQMYVPVTQQVTSGEVSPITPRVQVIQVEPSSVYPFPSNATLIRGSLKQSNGQPAAHVEVQAFVADGKLAKAKLAQGVSPGDQQLRLKMGTTRIRVGERFLLRGSGQDEVCIVSDVTQQGEYSCELTAPLQRNYERGALLLPLVQARSDQHGKLVVRWSDCPCEEFGVTVRWTNEGKGPYEVRGVRVREGQETRLEDDPQ